MSKFRFIIVACVLLMTICIASGAQVTTDPKTVAAKQLPMAARVLPKNEAQKKEFAGWQQLYGYGQDSHIYYNLAVIIAGTDQHGQIINRNVSYINMILAADDPNSLASMVVRNHNTINSLAEENALLQNRLSESLAAIAEQQSRILALEYRTKALEVPDTNAVIFVLPENCWQCTSIPYTGCIIHDPKELEPRIEVLEASQPETVTEIPTTLYTWSIVDIDPNGIKAPDQNYLDEQLRSQWQGVAASEDIQIDANSVEITITNPDNSISIPRSMLE